MSSTTLFVVGCLLSLVNAQNTGQVIDSVVGQGASVVQQAQQGQGQIRECSCDEERFCVEEMKSQAIACTDPCFSEFNRVAPNPSALKVCLQSKTTVLANFVDCFEKRVGSCVNTRNGPLVPKSDIRQIFALGEQRITQQSATVQALIDPIRHIVDAAGNFAKCVKNCFLNKNTAGFCFDRYGCQPLIEQSKASSSLKACTRSINWKKEAADLCTCGVNAGLSELQSYCSMFEMLGRRRPN